MASDIAMGLVRFLIQLLQCLGAVLDEKWKISLDGTTDHTIAHI